MEKVIRLAPVFKQMIWGGNRMREVFGYDIPGDDTGECWAISANRSGDCTIVGGEYDGKTLSWLWENEQELFRNAAGGKNCVFPLLTKIIDAKYDLSIQVHPDDAYAGTHENGSLGKMECWYILDCAPDATLVLGHNARTAAELEDMIRNGRWDEFVREIPIKKGDFFQIDPGTVHAIKGGTMLLETQQNSDITYRVYDYGRLRNGVPRQLHIQQSIDVITVPSVTNEVGNRGREPEKLAGEAVCIPLVSCERYKVWKTDIEKNVTYVQDNPFLLCSVIEGEGTVLDMPARKGDHFILTAGCDRAEFSGKMSVICSSI